MRIVISELVVNASTPCASFFACDTCSRVSNIRRCVENKKAETDVVVKDVGRNVAQNFLADQPDVAPEVIGRQSELDKLLLLHEDVVRDVVHDLGTEHAEHTKETNR